MEVLKFQDGMVTDEDNNVDFIYPVSALPTNHHVKTADGREFCAMCAIDSMGAAFTLHTDTIVDSVCAVCGEPVHVEIKDGRIASCYPEELHALTFPLGEISNWSGSCWNTMNFFCSSAEFDKYAEDMELDKDVIIKCDAKKALEAAKDIFSVD